MADFIDNRISVRLLVRTQPDQYVIGTTKGLHTVSLEIVRRQCGPDFAEIRWTIRLGFHDDATTEIKAKCQAGMEEQDDRSQRQYGGGCQSDKPAAHEVDMRILADKAQEGTSEHDAPLRPEEWTDG